MWYTSAVQWFVDLGLLDVILPFILVFVFTFAVLEQTRVLGEEKGKPRRNINALVAFVFGFFAVVANNVLNLVQIATQNLALAILVGFMFALIVVFIGGQMRSSVVALVALGIFGILTLNRFFQAGGLGYWIAIAGLIAIGLGVIAYLLWPAPKETEEEKKKREAEEKKGKGAQKKSEPEVTDQQIEEAVKKASADKFLQAQKSAAKAEREAFYKEITKK